MGLITCNMCGSEIIEPICPHCKSSNQIEYYGKINKKIVTILIKENMPSIKEAIQEIDSKFQINLKLGVKIIKVIHGYGSSGIGGALQNAIRNHLRQKKEGQLIIGEQFSNNNKSTKRLFHDFPQLKKDKDFNKKNKGISIFVF